MELCGLHPSQSRRVNAAEPKGATTEQNATQLKDWFFGSLTLDIWMLREYVEIIVHSRDLKGKPFNSGEEGIPDVCHSSCLLGRSEAGSGIAQGTEMCHSKDSKLGGWMSGEMELGKAVHQPSARGYKSILLP